MNLERYSYKFYIRIEKSLNKISHNTFKANLI